MRRMTVKVLIISLSLSLPPSLSLLQRKQQTHRIEDSTLLLCALKSMLALFVLQQLEHDEKLTCRL